MLPFKIMIINYFKWRLKQPLGCCKRVTPLRIAGKLLRKITEVNKEFISRVVSTYIFVPYVAWMNGSIRANKQGFDQSINIRWVRHRQSDDMLVVNYNRVLQPTNKAVV